MAKNYSGRDYLLYVTTTEPGTDSWASNYSKVGKITALSISESRNVLETSNKDDGDNSSFVAGRRNITLSGSAVFDHTDNTGQAVFNTAVEASNGTVYFLITSNTASNLEWYGSGVLSALSYDFPDEDVSTIDFEIQVTGSLTEASDGGS